MSQPSDRQLPRSIIVDGEEWHVGIEYLIGTKVYGHLRDKTVVNETLIRILWDLRTTLYYHKKSREYRVNGKTVMYEVVIACRRQLCQGDNKHLVQVLLLGIQCIG